MSGAGSSCWLTVMTLPRSTTEPNTALVSLYASASNVHRHCFGFFFHSLIHLYLPIWSRNIPKAPMPKGQGIMNLKGIIKNVVQCTS